MTKQITTDDIIDVRDIIERIEKLREEIENIDNIPDGDLLKNTVEGAQAREELDKLESLMNDLKGNGGDEQWEGDWYPITLIRDGYFEQYMDEMLEDCGNLPKDLPSYLTITVDYVALQMDYTSVEIDGVTYWYC